MSQADEMKWQPSAASGSNQTISNPWSLVHKLYEKAFSRCGLVDQLYSPIMHAQNTISHLKVMRCCRSCPNREYQRMQNIAASFIFCGVTNSQAHEKTLDSLQMAQFVLAAQHRCNNGDYVVALDSTRDRLAAAARSRKAEKLLNCDSHKGRRTSWKPQIHKLVCIENLNSEAYILL